MNMSKSDAFARRKAHTFIYTHPLRDEFLDWMDDHEDVVDDLKLVVEKMAADGDPPVEDATLIERLRADFEDIREEWAPLLGALLLWEFPELRPQMKRGVWKDIAARDAAEDNKEAGSDDAESLAAASLSGEAA